MTTPLDTTQSLKNFGLNWYIQKFDALRMCSLFMYHWTWIKIKLCGFGVVEHDQAKWLQISTRIWWIGVNLNKISKLPKAQVNLDTFNNKPLSRKTDFVFKPKRTIQVETGGWKNGKPVTRMNCMLLMIGLPSWPMALQKLPSLMPPPKRISDEEKAA